jgi:hypothetical protein
MNISVISAVCLLLVVIQISQCVMVFGTKDQIIDEKDLALGLKEIIDSTQNNGTMLVRHKRGQCCGGRNFRCCCKVWNFECTVKGDGHSCRSINGPWDCEGCRLGWKC